MVRPGRAFVITERSAEYEGIRVAPQHLRNHVYGWHHLENADMQQQLRSCLGVETMTVRGFRLCYRDALQEKAPLTGI